MSPRCSGLQCAPVLERVGARRTIAASASRPAGILFDGGPDAARHHRFKIVDVNAPILAVRRTTVI